MYNKNLFGGINLVQKYKAIILQSRILSMSSCKQGHTIGSKITKKSSGELFCYYCKDFCFRELFCKHFGQNGMPLASDMGQELCKGV